MGCCPERPSRFGLVSTRTSLENRGAENVAPPIDFWRERIAPCGADVFGGLVTNRLGPMA
jgi:hypothetical protein